ncbi:EAL domain-containing protein [Sphingomonas sp. MMS12-HWE2-04]|uniref:bifunctional diguanylate cyclase/phosphodiesterase n=1 Tax=Sphingomonas sp. MMS12-HWE2-04 TaxID=3234199 RepID=UPI00384A9400
MLRIYYCLQNEHDFRLVVLAGLICIAASMTAVTLLRHARQETANGRVRRICWAGLASGFGIWATHFIAVLGYDPGIVVGYEARATFLSLLVSVAATTSGFLLAFSSRRLGTRCLAAAIVGGGVAAMHYLGMQAVEVAGHFTWSAPYVIASLPLAIVPMIPALGLALDRRSVPSAIFAGLLFVAAILSLHFTGMAGMGLMPDSELENPSTLLSSLSMAIAVAGAAFSFLAIGMMSALLSGRARAAIAAREREFRVLVQGISDCALYMLSAEGRVVSWNAGAQRLKGYTAAEAIGLALPAFYSPEDAAAGLPARAMEIARREGKFSGEGWRYRKDRSRFWAHVTIETVRDANGKFFGFAKITRDMTRFKEDQDRLEALTRNLDTAMSNMQHGLCLFGPDERLIMSNARVGTLFNLSHDDVPPGTLFADVFRLALEKRAGGPVPAETLKEVLRRHRSYITRPDGGTLIVSFTAACTLSVAHRPTPEGGWVTTFEDISEQRRAEQRIAHMALHDGLTGLPNRVSYNDRLDAEIETAARNGEKIAVVGIDLDRFKDINDSHGHAVGDLVLIELAQRMRGGALDGECIARFGGDEFAAFKCFTDDAELADFVARLETALTTPVEADGLSLLLGASLGVALFPADGQTREQVINNADLAMYRAKATVGRQTCFYEPGMDEAARTRRVLANDLREAIPRGELSVLYQVQRSVSTGEVTGYEALLRWRHPRDGWISPAEFIPIAEESGEILQLGEWVLRTACTDAARWPEPWRVAVNLSPIQLLHVGLVEMVANALVSAGLPAHRLELEITETAFVADKVRALHVLRQIKALGVAIAIDDFGTGYSSLDTLNSFPFDKIKIDKSFLIESDGSHQARAIIRAVLALGRSLEVPVLAEGLENEGQLRLLESEGCDEAQGYFWGRPAPHGTIANQPIGKAATA